jgi:hypothetical protein
VRAAPVIGSAEAMKLRVVGVAVKLRQS